MTGRDEYERWLSCPLLTQEERDELAGISDDEIASRFFAPLSFGTAGLRGVMGAGINRMNARVVAQTTRALAELVRETGGAERGIAICFDCREHSREFAETAAQVVAAAGVRAIIFEDLRPTPELSFAIRREGAAAGLNITASHNTREYNGYKVYWADGAQLPPAEADVIAARMEKIDVLSDIPKMPLDEAEKAGLLKKLGAETDEAFLEAVLGQCRDREAIKAASAMKIVYTPFHGTGYRLVPEALSRAGFENIVCVDEQMIPDGTFPTVKSPNPEDPAGFALALDHARRCGADLVMGTDPDADRFACLALHDGEYRVISGNQLGALLLDYVIGARRREGDLPEKAAAIKSLVSTGLADAIAKAEGVRMEETFTGFKFLAERMGELEADGWETVLCFEEAIGYLIGGFARDKDGVTASVVTAEMAAYHFAHGKTLVDALEGLYERFGRYEEKTVSLVMPGIDGIERRRALMASLRESRPAEIASIAVASVTDCLDGAVYEGAEKTGESPLSGADVLRFSLASGDTVIVRPSGTEPKVKIYLLTHGGDCAARLERLTGWAKNLA
jgi:phosphoglucomutase